MPPGGGHQQQQGYQPPGGYQNWVFTQILVLVLVLVTLLVLVLVLVLVPGRGWRHKTIVGTLVVVVGTGTWKRGGCPFRGGVSEGKTQIA